jgi:hypothetical protein
MGFSILNHEKRSMLELSYLLGAVLVQELPDLEPLFETSEPHEVPHEMLPDLLVELTEAVQAWIREGRLDSTKHVYLGRRRNQNVAEYTIVEAARDLRDAIEEQVARGASLWIA